MENQLKELNNIHNQVASMRERHNNNLQVINNVERWKVIDMHPKYSISTYGRLRQDKKKRILKNKTDRNGYHTIDLCINGKKTRVKIHRLVAFAFIDNLFNKKCVDHIDNNRKNNNINNLRWVTFSENGMNMSKKKSNTSGITGVCWNKRRNKWCAQITIDGIKKHLGYFKTIEEARETRIKAVNEMFKEFAHSSQKI
jgi:hypothetical protein